MKEMERLKLITQRLRGPDGCEWDQKQDFLSMREDLLEELYELIDAITRLDYEHIEEELGDVLFLILFYTQLGAEKNHFDLNSVAAKVNEKLIRRHPHVFGDAKVDGVTQILDNWEKIKAQEKKANGAVQKGILNPKDYSFLPALKRAHKIQNKAAKWGFDWPDLQPVLDKLDEEIAELKQAIIDKSTDSSAIEDELGDVLFSVVNVARYLDQGAEFCLHSAIEKFIKRFGYIEQNIDLKQKPGLDAMEKLWIQAKEQGPG